MENSTFDKIIKKLSKKEVSYTLFGNILGDGRLRLNKKSNHWIDNSHANKQRSYAEWLLKLYQLMGLKTVSKFDYLRKTNYGSFLYSDVSCQVLSNRHFEHNRILINKKKIISDYVLNRITSLGILLWWLDDGHLSITKRKNKIGRFGKLSTHSFSHDNVIKIQKMFLQRFDIETNVYKEKNGYIIYFNASNFRKLFDLVRDYLDYIPEDMKYKFDMKYEINRLKNSSTLLKYNLSDKCPTTL